jgi:hypothetical protein
MIAHPEKCTLVPGINGKLAKWLSEQGFGLACLHTGMFDVG